MSTVAVYSADDGALTAHFVIANGRQPVPGDAQVVGNTRWVLHSGGRWIQDPVAGIDVGAPRRERR